MKKIIDEKLVLIDYFETELIQFYELNGKFFVESELYDIYFSENFEDAKKFFNSIIDY